MKIIIKTLSGQVFNIDVEGTDTILNIKEKILAAKQFEVAGQKILRKGTLLEDQKTVADLGIQENEFLVVMYNQKKQNPPPVQQPPAPQPVPPPLQPVVQPQPGTQPATQPGAQLPAQVPTVGGPSTLLSGPQYEEAIQNMINMGFQREECQNAMRAAYNNPERAVEYLLNGFPPGISAVQPPHPNPPTTNPPPQPTGGVQGGPLAGAQLQQLFQTNPQAFMQLLPQLLQQIQQTNPALYQQFQQNPEAMLQMLLGGAARAPPAGQIHLSPKEHQDVETIMMMGEFGKQDSLEAYLACDKNVEIALNYLYEKQARGDLLSQHIQRERNNPENAEGHEGAGDLDEEDDDDDVAYQ